MTVASRQTFVDFGSRYRLVPWLSATPDERRFVVPRAQAAWMFERTFRLCVEADRHGLIVLAQALGVRAVGEPLFMVDTATLWRELGEQVVAGKLLVVPDQESMADPLAWLFSDSEQRAPISGLADHEYRLAASTLGVDAESVQAVAEVETQGRPFDERGRPVILFERHYFHRLTNGRYDAQHAAISNATAGGYGKFTEQYAKLAEAYSLDRDAALKSASWGRFQIMGSSFRSAGFDSVESFVLAMTESEARHLGAFVNFIARSAALRDPLRAKNWAAFAAAYNGGGYKRNDYDTKLKAAYERLTGARGAAARGRP